MARIVNYKGLGYEDVGIVPSLSSVNSRSEIPLEGFRIVVAGMTSVICDNFLMEWAKLPKEIRPMIHIPRDSYSKQHLELIADWKLQDWIWVGVGLKTLDIEDLALNLGYKNILLDNAHGGLKDLKNHNNRLRAKFGIESQIITGSIATQEQANYLCNIGFDGIRSGVGTGGVCATKNVTGVHIKPVSELINLYNFIEGNDNKFILADGGFKSPSDFCKAFLLGASYCMSGFVFTKCKSARMHIDGSGTYYGMSDKNLGVRAGQTKYSEAFTKKVETENLLSLFDILNIIWGGVRSMLSYTGFSTLESAIGQGEFCEYKTPIPYDANVWG